MIKILNPQNIMVTPIVSNVQWSLNNTDTDLILLDTASVPLGAQYDNNPSLNTMALEYLDYFNYSGTGPILENYSCSIALEATPDSRITIREGEYVNTPFNTSDDQNSDGTYKRLVYNEISNLFYNKYKNPLKILGLDNIDFGLSKTYRYLANNFLIFNISPTVFGDQLVPFSISLTDLNIDDNVIITDDGYDNITVGTNIFYRIQEVRSFGNTILTGSIISCSLAYTASSYGALTGILTQSVILGLSGTPITAIPNTGYSFVKWSDTSTQNPRIDTGVVNNISVTASFGTSYFNLNYNANFGGTVSGSLSQLVAYGGNGTSVTAIPSASYYFENWTDGSIQNPRTNVSVTQSINVFANFGLSI